MKKLLNSELNRISLEDFKNSKKKPIIIILDNVRSANNVGSIFRTCDAFLVENIYLCGITSSPPNKEISKTALGATESMGWKYFAKTEEAVNLLKKNNYQIIAMEQADKSICLSDFRFDCNEKYALIYGNEVKGVEQDIIDLCDYVIEIPQFGTKHSFNICVSVGITLWEITSKLRINN
jgi:23S rRNA (guanosine2251-2'-O)-methyltransferase